MANLSLTTVAERTATTAGSQSRDRIVVAGFGDPAADDYRAFCEARSASKGPGQDLVVFVQPHLTAAARHQLDVLVASFPQPRFVAIVSSIRPHFGDEEAAPTEQYVKSRLNGGRTVIFRTSAILSEHSRAHRVMRRLGFCYPVVPKRVRGCCVEGEELFAAIDQVRQCGFGASTTTSGRLLRRDVYTMLGANRPWRDRLREQPRGLLQGCGTLVCYLLALSLVGHLAAFLLDLFAWKFASLRRFNCHTLWPRNFHELLAIYHPFNAQHVKIVGYNNGVVHFGHRYPGKTVVSTIHCNRVLRASSDIIKADCGATIRKAGDFLADSGQELCVIPNYSYVALGTAFFVPIHGSAADYSTVAETITRALLYDADGDRLFLATRDEPLFRDHVYSTNANVIVLRLWLRVKPGSRYFVQKQEIENASSADLLDALVDAKASNVEIRKSSAATSKVEVSKYYHAAGDASLLEVPRDSLGRLWDRLEENALTSFLFHALTRWLAWHVELFFTPEEFATFWATHAAIPIRKIQVRHIKRDGFTCSPFRDHDCISVDMFLMRWHRRRFEAYLQQTFSVIRANPGKHSR